MASPYPSSSHEEMHNDTSISQNNVVMGINSHNTSHNHPHHLQSNPSNTNLTHLQHHQTPNIQNTATDENDEDLMTFVICSIADFATDLATTVSRRTGTSWTPKILRKDKGKISKKGSSLPVDPNRPKRAPTSYFLWCEHTRQKMREQDSGRSVNIKDLADMWKTLSDSEKLPWERKSTDMKEIYYREMAAYRTMSASASSSSSSLSVSSHPSQGGGIISSRGIPTSSSNSASVSYLHPHHPHHRVEPYIEDDIKEEMMRINRDNADNNKGGNAMDNMNIVEDNQTFHHHQTQMNVINPHSIHSMPDNNQGE